MTKQKNKINDLLVDISGIKFDKKYSRVANLHKYWARKPWYIIEQFTDRYTKIGDVVLDPFAGTGTVGKAAVKLSRRFVLFEQDPEYLKIIQDEIHEWLHNKVKEVNWINTQPLESSKLYINF